MSPGKSKCLSPDPGCPSILAKPGALSWLPTPTHQAQPGLSGACQESKTHFHCGWYFCPQFSSSPPHTHKDCPKINGWARTAPVGLCGNNTPRCNTGSPKIFQRQQESEYRCLRILGRVVPTSGPSAPPLPEQWALRTPPSLRRPWPLCAFSALPAACHAPTQAPALAAARCWEGLMAKPGCQSWETGNRNKFSKLFHGKGDCQQAPAPNTPGPRPPSCRCHPISTHIYTSLYKRWGSEGRAQETIGPAV